MRPNNDTEFDWNFSSQWVGITQVIGFKERRTEWQAVIKEINLSFSSNNLAIYQRFIIICKNFSLKFNWNMRGINNWKYTKILESLWYEIEL